VYPVRRDAEDLSIYQEVQGEKRFLSFSESPIEFMKICISTLVTPPKISGVGHYIVRLLEALQRVDKVHTYYVLVGPDTEHLFHLRNPNFHMVVLPFRHDPRWIMRPLYFLWQNTVFRSFAKKNEIDLLFIPNLVPVLISFLPTVFTLHDLAEFYTVRYSSRFRQAYRRKLPQWISKFSKAIITISEHSKHDLESLCGVDSDLIKVIYEAPGIANDLPENVSLSDVKLPVVKREYILYVGKALEHKNLYTLVDAFKHIAQNKKLDYLKLVLAGGMGAPGEELREYVKGEGLDSRIVFTGYVSDQELGLLYKNASAFVFPSRYEGFGLPLLEAMQYRLPLIAANASCLPEIAGNAALFVEPEDACAWAEQITRLVESSDLQEELIAKGDIRLQHFSWEKCAHETVQVFEGVLK
jgi:glycosyltransferase involved in cell wall biosynthesis